MLFGLINASAIYQILVNNVLVGYLDIYAVTYLNNILIYSDNLKDYRKHITNILERFFIRQLRYKSEKYKFYQKEVDFLGFIVRIDRVQIEPEKVKKVFD